MIAENEDTDGQVDAGTLSAVVNVTVRILDANDNRPIIVVPPSNVANTSRDSDGRFDVCGRARAGDRLLQVVASDLDAGPNARLHYTQLDDDSESSSYFSVNAGDGWIVARQDLGRLGVGRTFPVTVVVTDGGRPPLSTNATFLLTVAGDGCVAAAAAAGNAGDEQVEV